MPCKNHFLLSQNSKNCPIYSLKPTLQPVCRVWPILTRSWVRQQSRTSGAGALKPCKNRQVRHFAMHKHENFKTLGHLGALSLSFKNNLGCAIDILCIPALQQLFLPCNKTIFHKSEDVPPPNPPKVTPLHLWLWFFENAALQRIA